MNNNNHNQQKANQYKLSSKQLVLQEQSITQANSHGFSLIELLVAMVVGIIIVSGAFALHSGTRKTQVANEAQMDMVADARFAIELISYDLRHAGMWGGTNKNELILCKAGDPVGSCTASSAGETLPSAITGDCAVGWSYNLNRAVFATDNTNTPYGATCIPTSSYVAGTDVLEIRYADSNEHTATALTANQPYIRSNFINGKIFIGTTEPELGISGGSELTKNHPLHAFAYYISPSSDAADDIPSLRRVSLVAGPALQSQMLVSGVTDLQVQFGEDVTGDQKIDRYVNPSIVTNWSNVYSAKIWLLLRSDKKQRGVNTEKSFTMAGNTASYGGAGDYRYFMVSSVVNLRNLHQL